MTNQTPLNPDATENAADVIWMNMRNESGVCDADRRTDDYATIEAITSVAIKEYLAVAQPVVTSVEELDALPVGTVIQPIATHAVSAVVRDQHGTWAVAGHPSPYSTEMIYLGLHGGGARVLYRPEVNDA